MFGLIRLAIGCIGLAVAAYVCIEVPVGRKTLFEHGVAIWRTKPALELREDVSLAARSSLERVARTLGKAGNAESPASP